MAVVNERLSFYSSPFFREGKISKLPCKQLQCNRFPSLDISRHTTDLRAQSTRKRGWLVDVVVVVVVVVFGHNTRGFAALQ